MKKPYKATRWIGVDGNGNAWIFPYKPRLIGTENLVRWIPTESGGFYFGQAYSRRGECFRVMVTEISKRKGKKP